jgi:AbrB family transcriptional regulator (stage V sporulation protein T)
MNITLDRFGRIVIPKAIRRRLGLEAGAELRVEAENGAIVLRPVTETPPLLVRDGILVSTAALDEGATPFDVVERIRAHRRDRLRDQGGGD